MGADGGWARNSNVTRAGQEFFQYMRSALTAVGLITKVTHHIAGYVPATDIHCILFMIAYHG